MSLTQDELVAESKAKIFNAYYGSLANFLIPAIVAAATIGAGFYQHGEDSKDRKNQELIARQKNVADMQRQCVSEMRETAKMLTVDAGARKASYNLAFLSVVENLNNVCSPVQVYLPTTFVQALSDVNNTPGAPPQAKAAAAQVIASQPLRVFFHIGDESQRASVRDLELKLEQTSIETAPIVVPGIQLIAHAPNGNELRYANDADADSAKQLAVSLTTLLGEPVVSKKINANNVRPGTFEFWRAAKAKQP